MRIIENPALKYTVTVVRAGLLIPLIVLMISSCSHLLVKLDNARDTLAVGEELTARQIATLNNRFQSRVSNLQKEYGFPGITAAYALPQGYVSGFAAGMADKESGVVMQPHMLMLSASIGKMYVGAVISQLVNEGVLNLNDPLSKWLGHKSWYQRLPNAESIRIAHLASHTAGLLDHVYADDFGEAVKLAEESEQTVSPELLISLILDKEPLFYPGEGYHYTDTGFLLLGLVIEEATQEEYYRVLQSRLLKPLQLSETLLANRRDIPNITQAYTPGDNPFGLPHLVMENGMMTHDPAIEWTGGGLVSSSPDLVRWTSALFTTDIAGSDYGERILKNATSRLTGIEDEGQGYGLGVAVLDTEYGCMFFHTGWTPSYMSNASYFSSTGLSMSFMVNTDDSRYMSGEYLKVIRHELAEVLHQEFNSTFGQAKKSTVSQQGCR